MAKQVISILQPGTLSPREYIVPAVTTPSDNVIVLFKNGFTTLNLQVVQLSVEGLPTKYMDKPITWIANFGIRRPGTDEYVDVPYTVYVTLHTGYQYVYYDGKEVKLAPINGSSLVSYPGKVSFDLNIGDPGIGVIGNT